VGFLVGRMAAGRPRFLFLLMSPTPNYIAGLAGNVKRPDRFEENQKKSGLWGLYSVV